MDWVPLFVAILLLFFSLRHWIESNIIWTNFFTALAFLNLGIFLERNF